MVMSSMTNDLPHSCFRQQPQRADQRRVSVNPHVVHILTEAETDQRGSSSGGTDAYGDGVRTQHIRRRRRRCVTAPTEPQVSLEPITEEEGGEQLMSARRRNVRHSTAPAALMRRPLKWADPNACKALTDLVLDDRRRGLAGDTGLSQNAAPALCAQLIAPFLRFDAPLPQMLYVFGGRNQKYSVLDTVEMFDAWHGQWVQCPPLPEPRASATAAVLPGGHMIVVGGYDRRGMVEGLLASCELYDPLERRWKEGGAGSMLRARWGHGCASLNGRVYVVGGCSLIPHASVAVTSMETLKHCEVYDPEADAWSSIAPLRTARSGARAVVVGSRLLAAVGGCDDIFRREEHLRSVELYDPSTNNWVTLATTLQHPRPIAAVATIKDDIDGPTGRSHIFVVGGAASLSAAEVQEVQLPEDDKAEDHEEEQKPRETKPHSPLYPHPVMDMPEGRMGCQAATISLPRPGGPGYPAADSPSVVIIGGEVWDSGKGRARSSPKRAEFSSVLVFDIATGTWRGDNIMPSMRIARTANALCVGPGYAWQPETVS